METATGRFTTRFAAFNELNDPNPKIVRIATRHRKSPCSPQQED